MNHYFTDNRHLAQNRKEITFRFSCFTCRFITDNGVFCKDHVDAGSQLLLETIERHGPLGERVLDLGCGYGAIGIVLKKLYPNSAVTMAEINPRSLELAQENAQRNEVEVRCVHSDVYSGVEGNTFTDIVTNPPIRAGKDVVYRMFDEAYAHLETGGRGWSYENSRGRPVRKNGSTKRFRIARSSQGQRGIIFFLRRNLTN